MVDRTIAPAFVKPNKFTLPDPEIIHFDNGSRFFFLNIGEQPVIKLEFIFKSGNWFESMPGTAFFTGKMLLEGSRSFSSKEISTQFDSYGAFAEVSPGFDYVNLSFHLPTKHFEHIYALIREILFLPTFPTGEFELMKEIQLQELKVNQQKNNFVGSRMFRSKLYGNHPYGHVMNEAGIKRIKSEDLSAYYNKWMSGSFDVFLTGNFPESVKDKIVQLHDGNQSSSNDLSVTNPQEQHYFDIYTEKEDSLQSSVFLGKRCINRDHKDYFKLLLLNEVFGGYFGSRLMQNIREDKGYTYSIYSHMVTLKNDAYFVINSEVKKEHLNQTIEEIEKEIERLKNEAISQEELTQVKNYLKGSILNSFTSYFAITEKLKNIYFYELRKDFYSHLFDSIESITSKELKDLAGDYLFNQPLSRVKVG